MDCRAIVAREPGKLSVERVQVDPPGAGEVRLRVLRSGICGSDVRVLQGTSRVARFPTVLGHEGVGIVTDVGSGTEGLAIGDLVVTVPFSPCGACSECDAGDPLGCRGASRRRAREGLMPDGDTRLHAIDGPLRAYLGIGSLAEACVVAAAQVVPAPAGVDPTVLVNLTCGTLTGLGAVWGPAGPKQGQRVAVVGCGPVGRAVIQGAVLAGATSVVAVDLSQVRLDLAEAAGATASVRAAIEDGPALLAGTDADVAFEAAGTVHAFNLALAAAGPRGSCVVVGGPPPGSVLEVPSDVLFSGRTLIGAPNGNSVPSRTLDRALGHLMSGEYTPVAQSDQRWGTLDDVAHDLLSGAGTSYLRGAI